MSIERVDVLIVGSGPSGVSTALHLARRDPAWAGRVVIVEQAVHPREKLCGGGVTHIGYNILARLGLRFEPPHVAVREARLVYRDQSCAFHGNPVFRVVRRDEFDHWLVRVAQALGICVRQGEAVREVRPQGASPRMPLSGAGVEVVTTKGVFHAQLVVAADGARSFVRRALKWDDGSRVARLLEVLTPEGAGDPPEFRQGTAVFDFTPMSDGLQGYYWDFPSIVDGKPFMNRGVFDSRIVPGRPRADLRQILRQALAMRERNLDEHALKGHPLRWWDRGGRFAMPRVLLVGDAAGVDPLVGEGISFALGYGDAAAEAIADAFARQDFSFSTYRERLLRHPLFRQLDVRVRLARLLYRLRSPLVIGMALRIVRWRVRRSPWRDPEHSADERPAFALTEACPFAGSGQALSGVEGPATRPDQRETTWR